MFLNKAQGIVSLNLGSLLLSETTDYVKYLGPQLGDPKNCDQLLTELSEGSMANSDMEKKNMLSTTRSFTQTRSQEKSNKRKAIQQQKPQKR